MPQGLGYGLRDEEEELTFFPEGAERGSLANITASQIRLIREKEKDKEKKRQAMRRKVRLS